METSLQHPCDSEHPLILRDLSENCSMRCTICELYFNGPTYCCWKCSIFLHKSCAELPLKTEHPAHPEHPTLSLQISRGYNSVCEWGTSCRCGDCQKDVYVYCCDDCSFRLDVALIALTRYHLKEEEEEKEMIQHFTHGHPLITFNMNTPVRVKCRACRRRIFGPFQGCPPCSFYLHEWCARLPREIAQHPHHSHHHLTLFPAANVYCHVCGFNWQSMSAYKCNECLFSFDVRCASNVPSDNQKGDCSMVAYFFHQHRLAPFSVKTLNMGIHCEACGLKISGEAYGCHDCKFYLHRRCPRQPPMEMVHFPDMDHGIKAKLEPHEHDLTYFERSGWEDCSYCGESCKVDYYCCVACNFNVHNNCIRILPLSVKHDCHFHPLVLRDKFVPFDDEQYCDACEETRRPDRSVYYCAECNFAAHIGCVIPWVQREETRPAELRSLESKISLLEAQIGKTESTIEEMQTNLEAMKVELKDLRVKRDDLGYGEDEERPNMEMPRA